SWIPSPSPGWCRAPARWCGSIARLSRVWVMSTPGLCWSAPGAGAGSPPGTIWTWRTRRLRYFGARDPEASKMIIDLAGKVLARSRVSRWMNCPTCWVADCLDVSLTSYQAEILDAIPVRRRVAIRGPHGLGKSFIGAVAVNWFATTRELAGVDWKIITTASAWRHLEVYLWPEIHKWAARIDFETLGRAPFDRRRELMDLRLKLDHGAATAVASNMPEKIEGAHADSLLYILDEAKIIEPATWDSVEGAFSGAGIDTAAEAFALAMSTPG